MPLIGSGGLDGEGAQPTTEINVYDISPENNVDFLMPGSNDLYNISMARYIYQTDIFSTVRRPGLTDCEEQPNGNQQR